MSAPVPRLELRQGQSLVMTQQLQQSIKMLQLSSQELAEYLQEELDKNPLLAADEPEQEPAAAEGEAQEGQEGERADAGEAAEAPEPAAADGEAPQDWDSEPDDDAMPHSGDHGYDLPVRTQHMDDEDGPENAVAAGQPSLREHLLSQLLVEVADPAIRMVGQHLIDLVDEAGYIKEDTTVVAVQLGCDEAMIGRTFAILQGFEPAGVCARSLRECLAIQLRDKDRYDPAMQILLDNLDLVATGNMTALARVCGVDAEDVRDMCAELRALNPKPGNRFAHEPAGAVIPDVVLRKARSGWHVELNPAALPRVLVNRPYHALLSAKTRDKQERKYITDMLASANWLVKALDQRAQTILKVSTQIVAEQDAFFRQGIRFLRPLTLRDVAAATGMHESTVSRVTNGKYILTPRGTFELRYFFNAALGNASGGEGHSNKSVQHMIKELVDKEDARAPLSDDAIAAMLKDKGVDIARRTVAKYRDILGILSSSARRRRE